MQIGGVFVLAGALQHGWLEQVIVDPQGGDLDRLTLPSVSFDTNLYARPAAAKPKAIPIHHHEIPIVDSARLDPPPTTISATNAHTAPTQSTPAVGAFNKTPKSTRKWCKACGGHVFTEHPLWGVTDVYAASIPSLDFKPGLHVNYQETKLRMKDGLPKMKDMPKEMGGSGVALAE